MSEERYAGCRSIERSRMSLRSSGLRLLELFHEVSVVSLNRANALFISRGSTYSVMTLQELERRVEPIFWSVAAEQTRLFDMLPPQTSLPPLN
jgi:hypothetical protein